MLVDFLPSQEELFNLLPQIGSIALFFLLALGIVALPVPDETLMIMAGILIGREVLSAPATMIAAYAGSLVGITGSYFIGRFINRLFLDKHGGKIGLTKRRLKTAHEWFEKFGKWTLFFGYFVPGIRHLTGITAGLTQLEFPVFALFAYTGGIIWVTLFLSLGYFLGEYGITVVKQLDEYLDPLIAFFILIIVIIGLFLVRNKMKFKKNY